jgi:putative transposase
MLKTYKFRLYPTKTQDQLLRQYLGCARFVWNQLLQRTTEQYQKDGTFLFKYDLINILPSLKKEEDKLFLKEPPSQVLQQKAMDLGDALSTYLKNKETKGFPKFKSKHKDRSGIRIPQGFHFNGNRITLPKIGKIKFKKHRDIPNKINSCTIKLDASGVWFICLLADDGITPNHKIDETKSIGIDVGIKHFAVFSDGTYIENNKFLIKTEEKLKKAQRKHSKKQKGSNNRNKHRILLAKRHKKVTNSRNDFLNKLVDSITKNHDIIGIEDLNITKMQQNGNISKQIADVGWGLFYQKLQNKCTERGKLLIKTDKYAPSSKTCSCCGSVKPMPLNERQYICDNCGLSLDRDLNAAYNIRNWVLQKYQNTAGTAEINACGDMDLGRDTAQEATCL